MATITPNAYEESRSLRGQSTPGFEDLKITRVIVEDITNPRNDGTPGSALYSIPFALSRKPPSEWARLFIANWNHPPRFTLMHRPGIASVFGSTVILAGTTIDEVERYHRDTLQLAVAETNKQYNDWYDAENQLRSKKVSLREQRLKRIEEISKRIKFD